MSKHTKIFYRAIARIKAVGEKNGVVLLDRIRTKLKIGYVRANKLRDELIKANVLREWEDKDFKKPIKNQKPDGNILWDNLNRFKIPRDISLKESKKVRDERKKGIFPLTLGEHQKRSRSPFKQVIRP